MPSERHYDIVLFGATGFTGELTAQYLALNSGPDLRWALAGRSTDKLRKLRNRLAALNPSCRTLDLLTADASDAASLADVAANSRVVITTVGPYIRYGEALVAACAANGTDYVDLTGEPEFVDRMWLSHHETAEASGARIVHCCGFDSIPHDLGALFTVQHLPEGLPIELEGFVRAGGDLSGGTWHSAITAFSRLRQIADAARQRRKLDTRPPDRRVGSTRQRVRFDRELGSWIVPFPSVDPQVVQRSAVALDRFGPDFRYGHYIQIKKFHTVAALLGGAGLAVIGAQFGPTRRKLLQFRTPGKGPGPEERAKAWFKVRFRGKAGNTRVVTEVSGGDPGYGETAKMLAESALCLALDRLPKRAGMLTPAAAMGDKLIKRLKNAGIQFRVLETS